MMYVRRPILVHAIQYDGSAESAQRCGLIQPYPSCSRMRGILVSGGFVSVRPGEWVVGGKEVLTDAEFHRDYEELTTDAVTHHNNA